MIVYIYNIGVDLYNGFNGLRHRINWTYFTVLDGLAHPLYSSNKTIKEFNEIYTNSPIFSTVLNHKKNQLSSLNISVTSTLYSDDFSNLDSINQMIFFTKILDLAIKYCSLSDEQRFIIIKSRKDIYSCTLQIIFNFPSTFENDIKESTSNIDKEFNTKSDISFDYNLKIVDIIFLMG